MPNEGEGNPNPGGSQGDGKLFTQAQVDSMITKRLSEDRKRRSAESLSDEERTGLLNKIEALETENGALKTEVSTVKTSLDTEKKTTEKTHRAFKQELVNRAIGESAAKAGAVDNSVVFALLEGRTRVREVTEDGQPTGRYVAEVKVTQLVDGKEQSNWVTPDEGVKSVLESKPFLVKSQTPPGAGTPPAGQPPAKPPGKIPEGVVKSDLPNVGHLPKGGGSAGAVSDAFSKAGDLFQQRLAQG